MRIVNRIDSQANKQAASKGFSKKLSLLLLTPHVCGVHTTPSIAYREASLCVIQLILDGILFSDVLTSYLRLEVSRQIVLFWLDLVFLLNIV